MKLPLDKYIFFGYILMSFGLALCICNCMVNYTNSTIFGNVYLYVISGIIFALGLTCVFNDKKPIDGENEKVVR